MTELLLQIFGYLFFISLTALPGSTSALFYEFGIERTGWITSQDFAAFLGFGFATPGPQLFSIATFIGYGAGGLVGALVGTVAIYVTPCVLAVLTGRYLGHLMHHEKAQYFVQSAGLAGAGLLIAIGVNILKVNSLSLVYVLIALGSFFAVAKWKINPLFIIVTGGLMGGFLLN